jgi:DNA-binding NtrC family response regulator
MRRDGRTVPRYDKVLLVEDEARLREMLLRALSEMGFSPTPAGTAEAAQRVLEREPHGIIILDLNLPLMSGMEFLTALRQRQADVQVIVLTGFGDLDAARKAIHLDVVDFLSKPCALGDLEIALDRARSRLRKFSEPELPAEPEVEPKLEFTPRETSPAVSLEDVERQTILAALEKNNGNRNATAAELGISLRKLYYRLAQYQKQGLLQQ